MRLLFKRRGYKSGSLFADDIGMVERLLCAQDVSIYFDVPKVSLETMSLADRHGMTKVFETARMYTKEALALERIFAIDFRIGLANRKRCVKY